MNMRKKYTALAALLLLLAPRAVPAHAWWWHRNRERTPEAQSTLLPPTAPSIAPSFAPQAPPRPAPQQLAPPPQTSNTYPQAPQVLPPDRSWRPPLLPAPTAPPQMNQPQAGPLPSAGPISPSALGGKEPLAWRARAAKMETAPVNAPGIFTRIYTSSYSDAMLSILASLSQAGLSVETMNSNAGEILARSADGGRIIICIYESQPNATTVKASVFKKSAVANQAIGKIFLGTTQTAGKRGSI